MKPHYLIIAFVLILPLFSSCRKDWLEIKSDAKLAVPSTLQDLQALLDNTSAMTISESEKVEISTDGHYITDQNFQNARVDENRDAYIWSKTMRHQTGTGNRWANMYKKVLYCNTILNAVTKYKSDGLSEQKMVNDLKGQALFQRAFEFFLLSQLYTPPYNGNESSDLGLILRLDVDITKPSVRSTIKATYDQIISDLTESINLLPDRPVIFTRGSKIAALALLARVNLYLENYSDALKYANECLSLYSKLLDYNAIPANNKFIGIYNDEVLFHASFSSSSYISTQCLIDNMMVDLYDSNDLRKKCYFFKNANGTYSYIGNYSKDATLIFCGLATDEVFLTRAECYARTGKVNEAMADLNTLLKARWDKNVVYPIITASDADDALKKILKERYKSLILRGTRWMDLRRLNPDSRFSITLTRTIAGTTYTLEPNSYKYTFPIPDDIIEQTGVKQNPGWQ